MKVIVHIQYMISWYVFGILKVNPRQEEQMWFNIMSQNIL